jgi:two-component system cell cycle sensor histidine kinase/response regulator CckA
MLDRTLGEDVTLTSELSAIAAVVEADPVELDQIILNLVVNARDALGPGGTIVVRTEHVELTRADVLNLPTIQPGPHVRLTVTDDGQGMLPDVLDRAFEPFYTTKGRGQGTGLGLSTVYGIVQRQGGHVVARSERGGGTVMEVLLPASARAAEPQPAVEPEVAVPGGAGRTVLLVEDEDSLRRAVRRMLEGAGFAVVEASDGRTALEHGAGGIDLLLTDIMMPGGVSGVDVADGLRAVCPRLPVVYMTGYSDAILDPERLDGATTLINKPFAESELLDMVATAIGVPA